MASTAASLAWAAGAQTPPDAVYLLPHRTGDGTGSDWENAVAFRRVNALAEQVADRPVLLFGVSDAFEMPLTWAGQQVQLNIGGTPDAPISLQFGPVAPDGAITLAERYTEPPVLQMIGNEAAPGERPDVGGAPYLVLGAGASNLHIAGPVFDRAGGAGFYNLDAEGALSNLHFSDIHARRVGRVIETRRGTHIDGLRIERCSVLGAIRGFARFRSLNAAEFRDLDLDADFVDGGGGAVCQLISVVEGEDLSFENVRLARAVNALAAEERGSSYIQGDGLVLEEETHRVRIHACHAEDMGDGGFDLKSEHVHMTNCSATRCKLGIRIWSHHAENLIERCVVTEPVSRPRNEGSCLWLAGVLTARDCTLQSTGDMSAIRFGSGNDDGREPTLTVEGGSINVAPGISLVTGAAGRLELVNVLVNGTETSGRYRWTGRRMREGW